MGTVKHFDAIKGYGFITPDDGGKDAFFHVSDILSATDRDELWRFESGVRVGCKIEARPKGPRATRVVLASAPPEDSLARLLAVAAQSALSLVAAGVQRRQVTDTISGWRVAERLCETDVLNAENGWVIELEQNSYLEVWLTPLGELQRIVAMRVLYTKFGDVADPPSVLGPVASMDDIRDWDGDYVGGEPSRSGSRGRRVTTQISRPIGRRRNPATWLAEAITHAVAAELAAPAPPPALRDPREHVHADDLTREPQRSSRLGGWFRRRGT